MPRFRDIFGTRDPRTTRRYRAWRDAIIRREPVCRQCSQRASIQVHHIEPVVRNPSRAMDFSNVIPVCVECHHALDQGFLKARKDPSRIWDGAC